MIAKRIDRAGKTSSFERLGHYVLEAKQSDAEILWTRTAEYVVDLKGGGEKVLWSRLSNCEAELPVLAIAEIEATQAQNTRSKADKTYHLVISFREGETPTREQLEDIEDEMCQALGYAEHQRISAVHQDTENLHLHVAINKVHPTRLKLHEPYRDFYIINELCQQLEQKHGLEKDNRIGQGKRQGRAGDLEAHTGEQSLLSWIRENLGETLQQVKAQGHHWADLHAVLAEHDLVIKPRGAGLVIVTADGTLGVKASAVDRSLSFKSLTDRFGDYQPPQQEKMGHVSKPDQFYQRGPRQRHPGASSLWRQYQHEKDQYVQAKAQALQGLRAKHDHDCLNLKALYRERRASVKVNIQLSGSSKRKLYQALSVEMKADFSKRKIIEREHRQQIQEEYRILSWDQWLVQKANQGHSDALAILRSRKQVRQRMAQALVSAETLDEAKDIIYAHLKPKALKNGDVLYRLKDGGLVSDQVQAVHVPEVTEAATLLALMLASERFSGKALVVEGSTEFKVKVAEMAVTQGLNIRFADPDLEKTRERFGIAREMAAEAQKKGEVSKPPEQIQEKAQGQQPDTGRDYSGR